MLEDSLYSLAEIAVTLAGFTGILAVFRGSSGSMQGELRRISYILALCFAIIIGAFMPGLIDAFWPEAGVGISATTALMGVTATAISIWAVTLFLSGAIVLALPVSSWSMATLNLVIGLFVIAAGLGFLPGAPEAYLRAVLLWFLLYSGYIFAATLIWGTGEEQ